jgi:hypothetical protein
MKYWVILLILIGVGCSREPDSAIVQRVDSAGAGSVRKVSDAALLDWFQKHQEVGQEVRKSCSQVVASNPPANWADTSEGRVCRLAQAASAFYFEEKHGDGKAFVPGK